MRNSTTPKLILLIAIALSGIAGALAISTLRTYFQSIPTTATVLRVETSSHLAANPTTEYDLINPSAVKAQHQHIIYLKIPGFAEPKKPTFFVSTTSPPPAPGEEILVRYLSNGDTIEVFPPAPFSLFAPALLAAFLALILFFLYFASTGKLDHEA